MVTVDPELLKDEVVVEYDGAMRLPQKVALREFEVVQRARELRLRIGISNPFVALFTSTSELDDGLGTGNSELGLVVSASVESCAAKLNGSNEEENIS
ncbi:hypothetical protein BT96DRAFT_930106 [Gymnopus androsaceus JB14]|uniref:Uncharacterized protein n=1 Tax=Gymnopus androsaceus JB14 TaxID=1447944 RepID=A0A6A4GBM4_9AGAR|nr:hypothetical protein BT96DRAFT_930106 [Gymnopus androsaceus JB14]